MNIKRGDYLLEAGVYSSAILHYLSLKYETNGVGMDIAQNIISKHSEISESLGLKNNYYCGDFRELPFKDNSFDYAVCLDLLEHISKEHQDRFLKEIFRVLKDNGRMLLKIPIEKRKRFSIEYVLGKIFKRYYEKRMKVLGHWPENSFSLDGLIEMAGKSGFKILYSDNIWFFTDYIYDNYFLALKDKLLSNLINNKIRKNATNIKFYRNLRHYFLRGLYYSVRVATFLDYIFCKLHCGVNFICLAGKRR